ncbi:MAG: GHKL domain-containing protein [Bifidobacteriaceae bacterium]|jgi:signal transduction histidine kinase|nr:GHKL domain-containing protein [Bifidobacteriaceae bacterium]
MIHGLETVPVLEALQTFQATQGFPALTTFDSAHALTALEASQTLPDIPRLYTGLAEWAAAVVYIFLARPRFSGWRLWVAIGAALPLVAGLQRLAGTWPLSLWMAGMGIAVLAMAGFIRLCAATTARATWYLTARAFVLAELVASLEWQLWVHWWPQAPTADGDPMRFAASVGLLAAAYCLGFATAWRLERRNFPRRAPLEVDGRTLTTAAGIALATFLTSNLSFFSTDTPFSGRQAMDIFYIRTLVDLAGFVALYAQQSNRNRLRDAIELAEARLVMRAQHEQYLQSKRSAEELSRMHHDLKHYAAAMRAEDSADRRSEYLQALEETIRGYESEIETGNALLDVVLGSKLKRCQELGIAMTCMVDGAALDFMDPMQLSALFGNALDNAIEASARIPEPEHRSVKVSAFAQGGFMTVRFENHLPYPVEFADGLPQTTKPDRARHGYGAANMRRVVESLGGSMTFAVEDGWFVARALIPRPSRPAAPAAS